MADPSALEWLETNGLGGYASGSVNGARHRKYHGYLCAAKTPPTNRVLLVADFLIRLRTKKGLISLTDQDYKNASLKKDVQVKSVKFTNELWPTWEYKVEGIGILKKEFCLVNNTNTFLLKLTIETTQECTIECIPLLAGRNHHSISTEKKPWLVSDIDNIQCSNNNNTIYFNSDCEFKNESTYYYDCFYKTEQERGYDCVETLFCPGFFSSNKKELTICGTANNNENIHTIEKLWQQEKKRRIKKDCLQRKIDHFIVQTNALSEQPFVSDDANEYSIMAGYPWFTDWGRDTFISMRGLLIAEKKYKTAAAILLRWSKYIHNGLLPNRFIDESSQPEYNTIDAPLWYIICCYEVLKKYKNIDSTTKKILQDTCVSIVQNFIHGTSFNIGMDKDCLLKGGQDGKQLTWMDAKYGDQVITPRIGKPVEIQCLWLNALWITKEWNNEYANTFTDCLQNFKKTFIQVGTGSLVDVANENYSSTHNTQIRCNQVFAIGGLPFTSLTKEESKSVLEVITTNLLTPFGLRTLSPNDSAYKKNYGGAQSLRDAAYHQGTVWPWPMGAYIDAYFYVYGCEAKQKKHAKQLLLQLEENLQSNGIGGINEVFSGDAPHLAHGCPWQAWSLSEYNRVKKTYNL